jgi:pyruvate kinase
MVASRLPTRAEATDVANAILDGTDCVMLSGESAMGKFPEEAVAMLAKIAASIETRFPRKSLEGQRALAQDPAEFKRGERMALLVEHALQTVPSDVLLVPTTSGLTARVISRCKPSVWIVAPSRSAATCQGLCFSYGVRPVEIEEKPADWRVFIECWLRDRGLVAERVLLITGPSPRDPTANHRLELIHLAAAPARAVPAEA